MKRKISFILIIFVFFLLLYSCNFGHEGEFNYFIKDEQVTITKYNGTEKEPLIPSTIKGYPVTVISTHTFIYCNSIESITIPDSVEEICEEAFYNCVGLETIILGKCVREIGYNAFTNCERLKYNIYEDGCYLGSIDNPYLAFVGLNNENIETINFHPDTKIICGGSLENNSTLQKVYFPENVISIGEYALSKCASLEKIYISKNVENISEGVFDDSNLIKEIIVAEENTYFKSDNRSLFTYDGSRLIKYAVNQDESFYQIPEGTKMIEDLAFKNAKHLTEIKVPDSVEEIGVSAFELCISLKKIDLGNSVKIIKDETFKSCTSLTEIIIPDRVEEIKTLAFLGCKSLETVVIGKCAKTINENAFELCESLQEVEFKNHYGWYIIIDEFGKHYESKIDVSDSKKNAENLTTTYLKYLWKNYE